MVSAKNKIGIMQGRLSPIQDGRIQDFPKDNWRKEFYLAKDCGFDLIEWVFDYDDSKANPLLTHEGVKKIRDLSKATGIRVKSVCANYFMENPFWCGRPYNKRESFEILRLLLHQCQKLCVEYVVIPMLEKAEINDCVDDKGIKQALEKSATYSKEHDILINIETSLDAIQLKRFLESLENPFIKINYDIGNSTGMGRNVSAEIEILSPWIEGIHVKDKTRSGESKPLGEGETDFIKVFEILNQKSYTGIYILETPRGENPVDSAKKNLRYVKEHLNKTDINKIV